MTRTCELPASRAILGPDAASDYQLFAKTTSDAQALTVAERRAFLRDLRQLGAAITAVYRPDRVSYQLRDQLNGGLMARVIPHFAR